MGKSDRVIIHQNRIGHPRLLVRQRFHHQHGDRTVNIPFARNKTRREAIDMTDANTWINARLPNQVKTGNGRAISAISLQQLFQRARHTRATVQILIRWFHNLRSALTEKLINSFRLY